MAACHGHAPRRDVFGILDRCWRPSVRVGVVSSTSATRCVVRALSCQLSCAADGDVDQSIGMLQVLSTSLMTVLRRQCRAAAVLTLAGPNTLTAGTISHAARGHEFSARTLPNLPSREGDACNGGSQTAPHPKGGSYAPVPISGCSILGSCHGQGLVTCGGGRQRCSFPCRPALERTVTGRCSHIATKGSPIGPQACEMITLADREPTQGPPGGRCVASR